MKSNHFSKSVLTLLFAVSIITTHAQQGKVWATIHSKQVPKFENGQHVSANIAFDKAINNLNIISIERALPSSQNPVLQQVYEITCNCDSEVLYATLTNKVPVVSQVEFAPNYETLDIPNDYPTSSSANYALDLINAPAAWDITHGDPNVYVAISDQNYQITNNDLVDKIVYYDPNNNTSVTHGTAVAMMAAGATNNSVGTASIGYDTKLALYQMSYNDVLAASYAGAKVINMSWTSGCWFNPYIQGVINEAYNNGTFLVAAAGNGSTCNGPDTDVYPASYDNVFSVTSVGPSNSHERIIGNPSTTHQHNNKVDLSAPGYNLVLSPVQGWFIIGSGTSYASPMVTGTVGLMLAVNSDLTSEDIETILKASSFYVDDVNPEYAGLIGAGRLDAAAAVEMALNFSNCDLSIEASDNQTVFYGYSPTECTSISAIGSGGNAPYTYTWTSSSDSYTGAEVTVCPEESQMFSVTVTDANGCEAIDEVSVCVINVECQTGNSGNMKVEMCQIPPGNPSNAHTICINESAVPAHLAIGCTLGACDEQNDCDGNSGIPEIETSYKSNFVDLALTAFPNPTKNKTSISLTATAQGNYSITLTDITGRINQQIYKGKVLPYINKSFEIDMSPLMQGIYVVTVKGSNGTLKTLRIIRD